MGSFKGGVLFFLSRLSPFDWEKILTFLPKLFLRSYERQVETF